MPFGKLTFEVSKLTDFSSNFFLIFEFENMIGKHNFRAFGLLEKMGGYFQVPK